MLIYIIFLHFLLWKLLSFETYFDRLIDLQFFQKGLMSQMVDVTSVLWIVVVGLLCDWALQCHKLFFHWAQKFLLFF
jgi:hypothetical protein